MERRAFLAGAAAGVAAGALARAAEKPVTQRPNILWICTDQQRWDTVRALGNPQLRTPNLDKLVETGVAFTHAYCQSPICTPSRASFLTGYYPDTGHGLGELFDMQEDPGEFTNLWDDPEHRDIRFELLTRSFDATAFAIDTGPPRVGRF